MKPIIATWICIDDERTAAHFPSAKGSSASTAVQAVYWRCVCSFFFAARFHHPEATLVLFSNQSLLPEVDEVSVKMVLEKLGVHLFVTPFEYVTPEGYYGAWRNQFYEFSIFKFVSTHPFFEKDDVFVLLDSDCVITGHLAPLFNAVQRKGVVTYAIDYTMDAPINGISRRDMRFIFQELCECNLAEYPVYHGGEFYASTVEFMCSMMQCFYVVWPQLLNRNLLGVKKLNEEAHVLSYLFFKKGITGGDANRFVKRLWTDPSTFRNVEETDVNLLIWHLPAEKTTGFKTFFKWLRAEQFSIQAIGKKAFQQRIMEMFKVPFIPLQQQPYYATKTFIKKYVEKFKAIL